MADTAKAIDDARAALLFDFNEWYAENEGESAFGATAPAAEPPAANKEVTASRQPARPPTPTPA